MAANDRLIESLSTLNRVVPELAVWRLRHPGFGVRESETMAMKIELLRRLVEVAAPAFLLYSEDPLTDRVPGQWQQVSANVWRLPVDVGWHELLSWLYLGGWMLYAADAAVDSAELLSIGFAPSAEAVAETVGRLGLRFLVISFHDDLDWTLAIDPDLLA